MSHQFKGHRGNLAGSRAETRRDRGPDDYSVLYIRKRHLIIEARRRLTGRLGGCFHWIPRLAAVHGFEHRLLDTDREAMIVIEEPYADDGVRLVLADALPVASGLLSLPDAARSDHPPRRIVQK